MLADRGGGGNNSRLGRSPEDSLFLEAVLKFNLIIRVIHRVALIMIKVHVWFCIHVHSHAQYFVIKLYKS